MCYFVYKDNYPSHLFRIVVDFNKCVNKGAIKILSMKIALVLCLVAVALVQAKPQKPYTDRYDNINVKEILENRRLLIPYLECMIKEKARCSPEAKELKSHIDDALSNDCALCTKRQKEVSREVIAHLINHEKDYWAKLVAKYDPTHKYTTKYEAELTEVKKG